MLLAIDIGNTNTVFGLFRDTELVSSWRLHTDRTRTADEWALAVYGLFAMAGLESGEVDSTVIVSVVPPVLPALEALCREYFKRDPLVIGPEMKTGMSVHYENPGDVGADRIVNAVAAYARKQQSLIVVDFGTATTFDVVSGAGEYLGGAIAPGLGISADALSQRASKLPRVALAPPPVAVATNTVHSMQAGLFFGYLGLVDGIIARMVEELPGKPCVLATGGLAGLIAPYSRFINEVAPDLTLEGLRIIFELNNEREE